jgi:sterol desaturase/sphingolipid hydroxylase (fatty acid hydroxylase superfamily)
VFAFVVVYAGFALLAFALSWAQRRRPSTTHVPLAFTKSRALDWQWWLFSPLVTGTLTRLVTLGAFASLAFVFHFDAKSFTTPLGLLPLVAQAPLALLFADVVGYFSHRLRHLRGLWLFHAVHHSASDDLDWLAAARMHPVDDVIDNTIVGLAVLLSGIDARIFALLGPILILHTMFVHADLDVDFGIWLASPAYHRRHHGLHASCNYAQLFPFVDALFGTFNTTATPKAFGVEPPAPKTLKGQLTWPFARIFERD